MRLTNREKVVYEAIKEDCKYEYSSDIIMISEATGIKINSVKGVVGSLTKKGLVECEGEKRDSIIFHDIFAIVDGKVWSFAVENGYCE